MIYFTRSLKNTWVLDNVIIFAFVPCICWKSPLSQFPPTLVFYFGGVSPYTHDFRTSLTLSENCWQTDFAVQEKPFSYPESLFLARNRICCEPRECWICTLTSVALHHQNKSPGEAAVGYRQGQWVLQNCTPEIMLSLLASFSSQNPHAGRELTNNTHRSVLVALKLLSCTLCCEPSSKHSSLNLAHTERELTGRHPSKDQLVLYSFA